MKLSKLNRWIKLNKSKIEMWNFKHIINFINELTKTIRVLKLIKMNQIKLKQTKNMNFQIWDQFINELK